MTNLLFSIELNSKAYGGKKALKTSKELFSVTVSKLPLTAQNILQKGSQLQKASHNNRTALSPSQRAFREHSDVIFFLFFLWLPCVSGI